MSVVSLPHARRDSASCSRSSEDGNCFCGSVDTLDKASLQLGELEQLLFSKIANGWDK
jgi:hypothetical protein